MKIILFSYEKAPRSYFLWFCGSTTVLFLKNSDSKPLRSYKHGSYKKNKADRRKSRAPSNQRRTNGLTDGLTDLPTKRLIELRARDSKRALSGRPFRIFPRSCLSK